MENDKTKLINRDSNKKVALQLCSSQGARLLPSACHIFLVVLCVFIVGCASTKPPVSVVDRALNDLSWSKGQLDRKSDYTVKEGDTLYSIAVSHGVTLSELAKLNGISNISAIEPGQQLSLSVPTTPTHLINEAQLSVFPLRQSVSSERQPSVVEANEIVAMDDRLVREPKGFKLPYSDQTLVEMQHMANKPTIVSAVHPNTTANQTVRIEAAPVKHLPLPSSTQANNAVIEWMWPTAGDLVEGFSKNSKGLRISGKSGQAVLASAAGEVVYSGSGLRGYGNLIIIKHSNLFLSAYAYNSKLLVKEGDRVAKGQKIAEMGNTDTDTVKLHFEIREQGSPVDPLKYLPSRS